MERAFKYEEIPDGVIRDSSGQLNRLHDIEIENLLRDTQTETYRETHTLRDTHRDTDRHTHMERDTHAY